MGQGSGRDVLTADGSIHFGEGAAMLEKGGRAWGVAWRSYGQCWRSLCGGEGAMLER